MWEFALTSKGTLRAKNLAKAVGLLVKLEVDLDQSINLNKSVNKVTIDMYDKDLMPVVDELYLNDQSH